jgi:hypothetical protein
MERNTALTDLWDRVAPSALAAMVRVFADHGRGVVIAPVTFEQLKLWEEGEGGSGVPTR